MRTYIIDVHTLGRSVFTTHSTTVGNSGNRFGTTGPRTFKAILESPTIQKVIFDVRDDADALFSHFGISMQGVIDLQLMENASRRGSASGKRLLHSLRRCIRTDSHLTLMEIDARMGIRERGRLKLLRSRVRRQFRNFQ